MATLGLTGSKTAELRRRTGILEDLCKELRSRGQVGGPAEPASVTSIEIHSDTDGGERLDGVVGAFLKRIGK